MARLIFWVLVLLPLASGRAADAEPADTARLHLQKGRYEEAIEIYESLAEQGVHTGPTIVDHSRALESLGRLGEAAALLDEAVKKSSEEANLWARFGELQFSRGHYDAAEKSVGRAIELDGDQPLAHLVQADVFAETGRLDEADRAYRWFVRYYNRVQPTDADRLVTVARGSIQYARWNSASQVFNFVVNTVCPDALKNDARCWQAFQVSGSLLLEKYNRSQALPEFAQALAINSRAVPVHVALGHASLQEHELDEAEQHARAALDTNPNCIEAMGLLADIHFRTGDVGKAEEVLVAAREIHPADQQILGRLAACFLLTDGRPEAEALDDLLANISTIDDFAPPANDRFTALVVELARRNPKPGYFLARVGDVLENRRQFDLAEKFYQTATTVMPQHAESKTSLGLLYMSVGKTDEARDLLDDAFRADPYHVRISNMRKVLKLLDGYETLATEHFVIRYDSEADKILARYMADYLEEVYDELVEKFGFEPPHRTTFEIYHQGKGLSAHQWFSARMVGLPWIQTIGASTGVIVALASPTASDEPYNWARVLKHEFVHVITMQQTHFHIPHWFTEALAVTSEGYPRPPLWDELLVERVPRDEVRDLDTLNDGFIRPESSLDWQFAYCLSRLYAEYMVDEYGPETIPKLLEAYRQNQSTDSAIRSALGVEQAEFERGFREHLDQLVAQLQSHVPAGESKSLAELERDHLADEENSRAAAAFAYGLLRAGQGRRARDFAEAALGINPSEPLAGLVMARISLSARDGRAAIAYLEAALDKKDPHLTVLSLLARIRLLSKDFDEAAELYELGCEKFPHEIGLKRGLAASYDRLDRHKPLEGLLEQIAEMDPDDASVRKRRAELALDNGQYAIAKQFARDGIYVDVLDAELHRILGTACLRLDQAETAIREFEVAVQLEPDDVDLKVGLAEAHLAAGDSKQSRTLIEKVLRANPRHDGARELMQRLE